MKSSVLGVGSKISKKGDAFRVWYDGDETCTTVYGSQQRSFLVTGAPAYSSWAEDTSRDASACRARLKQRCACKASPKQNENPSSFCRNDGLTAACRISRIKTLHP